MKFLGDKHGNLFVSSNEDGQVRHINLRGYVRSIGTAESSYQTFDLSMVNSEYLLVPNSLNAHGEVQVIKVSPDTEVISDGKKSAVENSGVSTLCHIVQCYCCGCGYGK